MPTPVATADGGTSSGTDTAWRSILYRRVPDRGRGVNREAVSVR